MLSISLHRPEDAILPYGATHSHHLQSQSFVITHDTTIFVELQISEMGHIALKIRDAIHATKGDQRANCGRFSGRSPVLGTSKLYDDLPDEIAEVSLINTSSEEQE